MLKRIRNLLVIGADQVEIVVVDGVHFLLVTLWRLSRSLPYERAADNQLKIVIMSSISFMY